MVRSTFLVAALVPLAYAAPEGGNIFARAQACNRDLCLRAVAASAAAPGTASASADCTKYLQKTVSLCPTTKTTTVTATVSAGSKKRNNNKNVARQLAARPVILTCTAASTYSISAVPSYASAPCSGSGTSSLVRYSTACSCNGITSISTVTLPQVTVTATTTTTTTTAAAPARTNVINDQFRFYFDDNVHGANSRIAIDYANSDPSKRGNLRDLEDNGGQLLSMVITQPNNYVKSAYDATQYLIQDPVSKVVTIFGNVDSPNKVSCIGVPYPGDEQNWYKLYCNAGTDNTFFACRTSATVETVYVTGGSVPPGFTADQCEVVGLRAPVPG